MNIKLLAVGKTDLSDLNNLINQYSKRLQHYCNFEIVVIPDLKNTKNLSKTAQKEKEGIEILKKIQPSDYLILLDENGSTFTSRQFAAHLQKTLNRGSKNIYFVIGGAFGFSDAVYGRASEKIALSKMTFSHQMVRLFFTEQLYRAFSILKNEPYHHD